MLLHVLQSPQRVHTGATNRKKKGLKKKIITGGSGAASVNTILCKRTEHPPSASLRYHRA